MAESYRFRIAGRLSPDLLQTFRPTSATAGADSTTFVTVVRDQAELFGAIARCETLGLRLLGLDALPGTQSDRHPRSG